MPTSSIQWPRPRCRVILYTYLDCQRVNQSTFTGYYDHYVAVRSQLDVGRGYWSINSVPARLTRLTPVSVWVAPMLQFTLHLRSSPHVCHWCGWCCCCCCCWWCGRHWASRVGVVWRYIDQRRACKKVMSCMHLSSAESETVAPKASEASRPEGDGKWTSLYDPVRKAKLIKIRVFEHKSPIYS